MQVQRLQAKSSDACGDLDFYGFMELKRGTQAARNFGVITGNNITPGWSVYATSNADVETVDAFIKIRDSDDFFCGGGDDDVDVNPDSRQKFVSLRINLSNNEVWLLEPDGDTFQQVIGAIGSPIILEGFEGSEVAIMTLQVDVTTEFSIIAQHSGKCLDVDWALAYDNGGNVQQWDCHGPEQTNQVWSLRQIGSHYQIVSKHSGKCLDVDWVLAYDNGGNVQQWDCLGEGQNNQLWDLWRVGDWYELVSVMSGKCMDVADVSKETGANVQQWNCVDVANQHWRLGW